MGDGGSQLSRRALPQPSSRLVPELLIVMTVVERSQYARHAANALYPLLTHFLIPTTLGWGRGRIPLFLLFLR